jgi:hypothetical protein
MVRSLQLFAPIDYPKRRIEIRAYTIASFRVAQRSDQLSLIAMPKLIIEFLMKESAIRYWKGKGWLLEGEHNYKLSQLGLVICQSALATQLPSHNTNAESVAYWEYQFQQNTLLPRNTTISIEA